MNKGKEGLYREMDTGELIGLITGAIVTIIGAITTAIVTINNKRSKSCDNPKCCVTGRKLKSKKKKNAKPKG